VSRLRFTIIMAPMKKRTARSRSSVKTGASTATVEEYLSLVSEPARSTLKKVRASIRAAAPADATEVLSYRIPAIRNKRGVIVWYAAFSDHCSLFPTPSVIRAFQDELKGLPISKGTIQFPVDKPLPAALLKKMVKERISQMEAKK
jgi:uncharacterized protein YdhG (YjbR/CyaY superfamily)